MPNKQAVFPPNMVCLFSNMIPVEGSEGKKLKWVMWYVAEISKKKYYIMWIIDFQTWVADE